MIPISYSGSTVGFEPVSLGSIPSVGVTLAKPTEAAQAATISHLKNHLNIREDIVYLESLDNTTTACYTISKSNNASILLTA